MLFGNFDGQQHIQMSLESDRKKENEKEVTESIPLPRNQQVQFQ